MIVFDMLIRLIYFTRNRLVFFLLLLNLFWSNSFANENLEIEIDDLVDDTVLASSLSSFSSTVPLCANPFSSKAGIKAVGSYLLMFSFLFM